MQSNNIDQTIEQQLDRCRWAAYHAQHRYGLLIGTARQVSLLQKRFPEKQVYNSTALRPFQDCFDMLVIDLCSAAEAWLNQERGLFTWLANRPALLRPRSEDDFGGADMGGRIIARGVNTAIEALVPDESPATAEGIRRARRRFYKATQRLRDDRNKVRAHRYEVIKGDRKASSYIVPLEAYEEHVKYIVGHVHQASLAIKAISFDTEIKIPERESEDLADLIFHGSIGGSIWAYHRVCGAVSREVSPRFQEVRKEALKLLENDPKLYGRAFNLHADDT